MRSFLHPCALRSALAASLTLLGALHPAHAQGPVTRLRHVDVSRMGAALVVSVEADGPLPEPSVGDAQGPHRVFLDFAGVIPATPGTSAVGLAPIVRVRVALHQSAPPVTRLVVDLSRATPARLELSAREAGRLRILFDLDATAARPGPPEPPAPPVRPDPPPPGSPAGSASLPPVPNLSLPPSPPVKAPEPRPDIQPKPPVSTPATNGTSGAAPPKGASSSSAGRLPAAEAERYRRQVGAQLDRLRGLRALLTAIDQQEVRMPGGLTDVRTELSGILRALSTVRPAEPLVSTHDLLVRSASLALMAITLRDMGPGAGVDQDALRNASSAAAGALLLLDRVCVDIGCGALPGR